MEPIYIAMPGNEPLTNILASKSSGIVGSCTIRNFPDGESYVQVQSNVENKKVIIVCTLDRPNEKIIPLYLLAKTLRSLGAASIALVSPYLAYMRQDKIFHAGEGISARHIGSLLSSFLDEIVTIDPHLHRLLAMNEIYTIPVKVQHAAAKISDWVKSNVKNAIIIGPDAESEQWVSEIASQAGAEYLLLEKTRLGDKEVQVILKENTALKTHVPVLVDDIISTGKTMIATIKKLSALGTQPPVCVAIHAVFAEGAFEELKAAGAKTIVTCNTITHVSNRIDISALLTEHKLPG